MILRLKSLRQESREGFRGETTQLSGRSTSQTFSLQGTLVGSTMSTYAALLDMELAPE